MRITLPGAHLATAWHNVWLSTSDDDARPQLYRTVLVEVFNDRCVQLIASDTYMLTGSTVLQDPEALTTSPSFDESPDETYVVMDHDQRMGALMKWVLKDAKAAAKDKLPPPEVTLSVQSAENPDVPSFGGVFARNQLVVGTERERLALDLYDGAYPEWRSLIGGHQTEETTELAFNPELVGRFGKMTGLDYYPVEFTTAGPLGGTRFAVRSEPPVFGLLMPVRVGMQVEDKAA